MRLDYSATSTISGQTKRMKNKAKSKGLVDEVQTVSREDIRAIAIEAAKLTAELRRLLDTFLSYYQETPSA